MVENMKQIKICFILGLLITLLLFSTGCLNFPVESNVEPQTAIEKEIEDPVPVEEVNIQQVIVEQIPTEETPSPEPTPLLSNVTNWNPYTILPYPTRVPNNTYSYGAYNTPDYPLPLNATYSESVGLNGYAIGKELNITNGPFSITYTVHPNISSPLDVWAKLTILDPWQNSIEEAGYNRGYSNAETQTMIVYREGRFYLIIEGDFLSLDYTLKTRDPLPISTPTPVTEEVPFEEEMYI